MLEPFVVGDLVIDRLSITVGGDNAELLEQAEVLGNILQGTTGAGRNLIYG